MAQPDLITEPVPSALIVVMGVSGTGKSTLGAALARALRVPYIEGDDLHPRANVEKMAAGTPLDDADREPWLALLRTTAEHTIVEQQVKDKGSGVVVTCSALKKYYREILRGRLRPAAQEMGSVPGALEAAQAQALPTYFVFIDGKRELLMERMAKRAGHFMKASMLDSQLQTLESPVGEEGVVVVSIEDSTDDQIRLAKEGLATLGALRVTGDKEEEK